MHPCIDYNSRIPASELHIQECDSHHGALRSSHREWGECVYGDKDTGLEGESDRITQMDATRSFLRMRRNLRWGKVFQAERTTDAS